MPVALFAINSYIAAGAYVQTRAIGSASAAVPETFPAPETIQEGVCPPSVFFSAEETARPTPAWTPYRSPLLVRFPQTNLPQDVVDYLLNRSYLTGHHYSLFRHGPAWSPSHYEVREGSPDTSDRSILGGSHYDVWEEIFFDVSWVAHVHPPRKSPLPSHDDLEAVFQRARFNHGRRARHTLFGFRNHEPVCVEIQAIFDPWMRGISLLHRSSEIIAEAADRRIVEWLDSVGAR